MIHYYFRTVLFLIAFFLTNTVFSQRNIYPFDDYSKCQIGFLKSREDTLYPAKFENLREIVYTNDPRIMLQFSYGNRPNSFGFEDATAWCLSENSKFGCLSKQGKWLLSCRYDSFEFNTRCFQFIARLNGKYGLVGTGDKVIIPFEYDQMVTDELFGAYDSLLVVRKDNLSGMIRSNGKEFVPAIYQSINRLSLYDWESNNAKNYFIVVKNNRTGLLDMNGEILIEPHYQMLELLQQEYSSRWEALFRVQDTLGRFSVLNGFGKQLLPFMEMDINPVYTLASVRGNRSVSFVERTDSLNRKQLISLITGKESNWYESFNFIGEEFFAFSDQQNGKWEIIDSNFNTIYSNSNTTEQLCFFDYENQLVDNADYFVGHDEAEGIQVYSEGLKSWFGEKCTPSVFSICKTIPLTKKEQKRFDLEPKKYYCLLNGKTGKRSPFVYQEINRIGALNKLYYWCLRTGEKEFGEDEVTIDIYDSSAVFLRTVCLNNIEYRAFDGYTANFNYEPFQQYCPLIFIKNEEGQQGAMHINGNRITPYVFYGEMRFFSAENDSTGLYLIKKDGKYSFFNFQAEPMLNGMVFDEIIDYGEMIQLQLGDQNRIISHDLMTLMDSCSKPFYVYNPKSEQLKSPVTQCLVVEKNGYLYLFSDGKFQVMNSDVFTNPSAKNEIRRDLFVDASGKIIVEEPKVVKPKTDNFDQIFVTLIGTDLKIEGYRAKKIQTLKNVLSYKSVGSFLKVKMIDLKEGFISIQTGQWQVKPMYEHLHILSTNRSDAFFAKDSKVNPKEWFVIKPDGTKITEAIFDTTFYMHESTKSQAFISNNKTGFINAAFEIVTPPIFERSVHVRTKMVWLDGKNCYLVDGSTGKPFRITHDMSCGYYPKGHMFLFNDSIQLLGFDGKELIPSMRVEDAVSNLNLTKYLYILSLNGRQYPYLQEEQIFCSDNDTVLFRLNNKHMIEKAKREIVSLQRLSSETYLTIPYDKCIIEPVWINKSCYAEKIMGDCHEQPLTPALKKQDFSYRNYAISPTGLVPITLADLFIEDSDYEAKLDLLIEKAIQRDQVFGANCPDMQGAIKEFKRNFHIGNGGIYFLHYTQNRYIKIGVEELKDVVRDLGWFEVVK